MFRRVKKWLKNSQREPKIIDVECVVVHSDQTESIFHSQSIDPLLHIIRRNDIEMSSYCGGMCSCGTCMIEVLEGKEFLSPISSREVAVLGFSKKDTHRLACQVRFEGEGAVKIAVPNQF